MPLTIISEERKLVLVQSVRRPVFDPKTLNETGTAFQEVKHIYERMITLSDGTVLTDQVEGETAFTEQTDSEAASMTRTVQEAALKTRAEASIITKVAAEPIAEPLAGPK